MGALILAGAGAMGVLVCLVIGWILMAGCLNELFKEWNEH